MRRLSVVLGLPAVLLARRPAARPSPTRRSASSGRVTDQAGVLSAATKAEVEQAIDNLQKNEGINEYVVFVDSFDGLNGKQWVARPAEQSGLGAQRRPARRRHRRAALRRAPRQRGRRRQAEHRRHRRRRAEARGQRLGGRRRRARRGHRRRLRLGRLRRRAALCWWSAADRRRRWRRLPAGRGPPAPEAGGAAAADRAPSSRSTPTRGRRPSSSTTGPAPRCWTSTRRCGPRSGPRHRPVLLRRGGRARVRPRSWRPRATSWPGRSPSARSSTTRSPRTSRRTRRMLAELLRLTQAAGERLKEQAAALDELRERERTAPQAVEDLRRGSRSCSSGCRWRSSGWPQLQRRYASAAVTSVAENVARGRRPAGRRRAGGAEPARQDQAPARPAGRWAGCAAPRTPSAERDAARRHRPARPRTSRRRAARAPRSGRRPRRTSPRRGRWCATGDRSGLRRRSPGPRRRSRRPTRCARPAARARPAGRAAAAGGGRLALEQALSVARDAQTQGRRAAGALDQALLTARVRRSRRPRTSSARAAERSGPRRGPGSPRRSGTSTPPGAGRDDPVAALQRGARGRRRWRAARVEPGAADRLQRLGRRLRRRPRWRRWVRRRVRRGYRAAA